MADCYYHGQSAPGQCVQCIAEGEVVHRGGVRMTVEDAEEEQRFNLAILAQTHPDDPRVISAYGE